MIDTVPREIVKIYHTYSTVPVTSQIYTTPYIFPIRDERACYKTRHCFSTISVIILIDNLWFRWHIYSFTHWLTGYLVASLGLFWTLLPDREIVFKINNIQVICNEDVWLCRQVCASTSITESVVWIKSLNSYVFHPFERQQIGKLCMDYTFNWNTKRVIILLSSLVCVCFSLYAFIHKRLFAYLFSSLLS